MPQDDARIDDPTTSARGLRRLGRTDVAPRGAAMAVGSVPHEDPREAVAFVLRATPDIPSWPQLPRRSFRENMYAQFSAGLPGVVIDVQHERVYVRDEVDPEDYLAFLQLLEQQGPEAFALDQEHAAGFAAFAEVLPGLHAPFVKGQVTGPVSFGLAVPREDRRALLYDDTLREAVALLLVAKARGQERLFARCAAGSVPLIMVDEPYLTQMGSAFVSIPEEISFELLEQVLAGLGCLRGIHVCGGTDWTLLSRLPVDLLNFDAADHSASLLAHREALADFVARGGLLCWGVVPNDDRAWELRAEDLCGTVLEGAATMAPTGMLDQQEVLRQSFVSPACGTGTLSIELAEHCLLLATETSGWLRARLGE
jgi:hypothetical protein